MRRPSLDRLLASLLSGLLAAGATPLTVRMALADEPARLLIVPFRPIQGQVSDAMAPKVEEILTDELHNHDDLQLATYAAPAPVAAAAPAAAASTAAGEGDPAVLDRIEKGEALVKKFKFKQGADALEAALSDYEGLPAQVEVKTLREAYTQLALAQMRSGSIDAGNDSLAAVIRLAPDLPLGGGYPPPFKRAFEQAKHKATSGPRGSVTVKGEGQIFLDSREQAAAPTTIENVIPGGHFLRVQRADGSVWGLKLIVSEGENTATIPESGEVKKAAAPVVAVAASGTFAGIAQNRIDDALLAEVAAAGKDANAAFVLFGGLYKIGDGNIGLAPHLYSLRAHGEVALDPVAFDPDLVSAGIVTNKLAGKIIEQVKSFDAPETLPAPVAPAIKAAVAKPLVVAAVEPTSRPPVVKPEAETHPVVKRKPTPAPVDPDEGTEKPVATQEPKTRTLTANPADTTPAGGLQSSANDHKSDDDGAPILLYGLIGGGAAVLIAAGLVTFVVVKNNSTPVSGKASLSFQ